MDPQLQAALIERFVALNGGHEMTLEDDEYARRWYSPLEELASAGGYDVDGVARWVLAGKLPLPGYVTSTATPMFARDLLALLPEAGGIDELPGWFGSQYDEPRDAVRAWSDYVSGQLVCLHRVTPATMQRKEELVTEISALLQQGDRSQTWLDELHARVDELDELEPPFSPYDRLRFGGPISRDRLITDVRQQHPKVAPTTRV